MTVQRRCSLALESPSHSPHNNPINAFLVYNSKITKAKSSPDLTNKESTYSAPENRSRAYESHNRRVSLCDLDNINEQLVNMRQAQDRNFLGSTHSLITPRSQSRSDSQPPSFESYQPFSDYARASPQTNCKKHQRRKSVAVKFENPRII